MITSRPISAISNFGTCGRSDVIFRDADQRRGERAKRVAQRGSLRHGGHLHQAEGNANAGADDERDDDPFVVADLRIEEGGQRRRWPRQFRR